LQNHFTVLKDEFKSDRAETIVALSFYANDDSRWLNEAIQSIISQQYTDFAFIIVIDGDVPQNLTDIAWEASAQDSRIILAKHKKNMGLASSMNSAIEYGLRFSPTFFARMDADDISEPNRLSRQIHYLKRHTTISVLGSALTEVNERGEKVGARVMPASHKQITKILPRRCSLNHPTVVIRYSVFQDGHRYDSSLRNTQDYFLWIELASHGYIFRNLKDRLLKFRRVNNFYKRRGLTKSLNEFKARLSAVVKLKQYSFYNVFYAFAVLALRMMPGKVVKLAYKLDRHYLEKFGKQ